MTTPRRAKRTRGPTFKRLTRRQMTRVLERNHIGRIAFMSGRQIELLPVSYVYADGAIYGRTSFGAKYAAWLHRPYVAFEVDESEGPLDWRSVVVHGTVYMLLPRGTPAERRDYAKAVRLIREGQPAAFSPRDPTPYRGVVFRVEPHEVTGRSATTS